MANNTWYSHFLSVLYARQTQKTKLVEELMALLRIEREAAYRRLRREVSFSIDELVKISTAWNISM